MLKELIGLAAVVLVIAAYIPYIYHITKGLVKPHPFSWLIWCLTAISIFFLQTLEGSGAGAYTTAAVAVFALLVFVFALRQSHVTVRPVDVLCLAIALVGLGAWFFVQQPVLSILLMLLVEFIGFIPTLRNTWRRPYDESLSLWGINSARHILALGAIYSYSFVTVINPIFWATLGIGLCIVMVVRRKAIKRPKGRKRVFRPHN